MIMSREPPTSGADVQWHLQFRKHRRALRFAQQHAATMCQWVSTKWCISIYECDAGCWPDWDRPPIKRWSCE